MKQIQFDKYVVFSFLPKVFAVLLAVRASSQLLIHLLCFVVLTQFELAIYFTKCELQPIHVFLGLRVAIKCGYNIKNLKTTANLCRRLLELCVTAKLPPNLVQSTDQACAFVSVCLFVCLSVCLFVL
jgi:hypothetical protein